MSNILRQYYQGILLQLRAEVDFINSLFHHQGVKGEGNETVLRDFIRKFIPKRYGIGTGVVIDRFGNQSHQCDIIIYDTFLYPSLLSMSTVHLFPVDVVYATIEVKTTLTSEKSKEALQNITSVKKLDYIKNEFAALSTQGTRGSLVICAATPPLGIVFAYNSNAKTGDTYKRWFTPKNSEDTPMYPSLVGCLDIGLVRFGPSPDQTSVLPEVGMRPFCNTYPIARASEDESEKIQFVKLSRSLQEGEYFLYEGINYPVKKSGDNFIAIDQSRVLLNFILILNDLLTLKRINPNLRFGESYLRDIDTFSLEF